MSTKKKRSYVDLVKRLSKTRDNTVQIFTLDYIKYSNNKYPFQKIILGVHNPRRVLISAGIHGDEPAGIETICSFLENSRYKKHLDQWEITILPCINPYGFENDTRENHESKDLNRLFKVHNPPLEVKLAKSIIEPSYFDMTIELHEDCDSHGYYLFQKSNTPNGLEIGVKIIEALKEVISINSDKTIENMPAEKGIIHRIKDINQMEWWPMAGYSLSMKAVHCLTLETPTMQLMGTRVQAHLLAIDQALMCIHQ
jgi:murein peptide amidase A